MKNLIKLTIVLLMFSNNAQAQQDAQLTQYMFNGLYLNPAYAGSHEYWSSTLTGRIQWANANFSGAPITGVASVDGPIRGKNMGLGFTVLGDEIGVTRTTTFMANYSYQIKLNDKQKLALGVNAGVSQFNARLTEVKIWDEQDVIYANNLKQTLPRFGVGAYYFGEKHYVGLSIPTLLAYQDNNDFSVDLSKASFLRRHYMLTGGVVFDVSKDVKFKPSVLLKYVKNAPLEGDINFSAIFKDAFWLGVTYRTNDAMAFIVEYQSNNYFRIGYSYDMTISGLRSYQSGSHEVMIGIDFGKNLSKIKTPRYF